MAAFFTKIGRLLLVLLLTCHSSSCSFQGREVCIIPDLTVSSTGGYCGHGASISITTFCQEAALHSNTTAIVVDGNHTLHSTCEFKNATNLVFRGSSKESVFINCSPAGLFGFVFLQVNSLTLIGMQFSGCGSIHNVTSKQLHGLAQEILSALLFIGGSNLFLLNVSVSNSRSAGLYVYNVTGNVTVDACKVDNASSDRIEPMSGSVFVYDNSTTSETNIRISWSIFLDSGYSDSENCLEDNVTSYSGGLSLFMGNQHTTFVISDSNLSSNIGCNGGNMALLIFDYLRDTLQAAPTVSILNTYFTHGNGYIGAGLYISFKNSFSYRKYTTHKSTISRVVNIVGSRFINNYAGKYGGGIYIQWSQTLNLDEIVDTDITDSLFEGNSIRSGKGGLALHYKVYLNTGDEAPQSFVLTST